MKIEKRHYLLLEVLIAFTIVTLCALPLIAPHSWMIKEESELLQDIEKDRYVNLIYSHIVEQMYANTIQWQTLANLGVPTKIDTSQIEGIPSNWPYKAFLTTKVALNKKGQDESQHFYYFSLIISLLHGEEPASQHYTYTVFVERKIKIGQDRPLDINVDSPEEEETDEEPEEELEEE
jgi:hypothetical protein